MSRSSSSSRVWVVLVGVIVFILFAEANTDDEMRGALVKRWVPSSYFPASCFACGSTGSRVVEDIRVRHGPLTFLSNASTSSRWAVETAARILEGHYSGQPRRCDFHRIDVVALLSVKVAELCHSLSGPSEEARHNNDPSCVNYVFGSRDSEPRPYSFGVFHAVTVVLRRRGRLMRAHIEFVRAPTRHRPQPHDLASRSANEGYDNDVMATAISTLPVTSVSSRSNAAAERPCEEQPARERTCDTSRAPIHHSFALRLMNWNVWNFNGEWTSRCRRIAQIVKEQAPDVALLQEVRIDTTRRDFASHRDPPVYAYKFHGVSQTEHLMRHLRTKAPFTFVFHPAMTYFHTSDRNVRFEMEGPMILHKFLPVVASVPFLLKRFGIEHGDDHQRLMLCSAILLPPRLINGEEVPTARTVASEFVTSQKLLRVDVCTAHFALSPGARLINAMDALHFMEVLAARQHDLDGNDEHDGTMGGFEGPSIPKASVTIFAGDLNAESTDPAIAAIANASYRDVFLEVQAQAATAGATSCGADANRPSSRRQTNEPHRCAVEDDAGNTFNANDYGGVLSKRIDFIFYKTRKWPRSDSVSLEHSNVRVTPRSLRHLGHRRPGVPPASDHVGMVADLALDVDDEPTCT